MIVEFDTPRGAVDQRAVVQRMTMGKADVSLSLWDRWLLFAGLSGSLRMRGERPPPLGDIKPVDGPGLGDISLGKPRALFRHVGEPLRPRPPPALS